ncbi:hypothetical protein A2810_01250 [candidate division Kazan bacterium RIFCSPHIGHO2_01_FULL_49_10]|uniref:Uncharacterized protein n=1 Tax=candidate division Kazan bacterium RIFCSPLOWO2_01_FULL_48_13 TaxID=1798539 RepID=A0A1F4PPE8_UNCK3|nr:MAG: hypothetical protein A2810_01250 [candidate division Kazan bacterium RIFCSPHIGHO2_01_FULL_49_10]OGB85480.1 MAG: hypothetical protein A2994_01435 [candidate division Kazan bacterium RIFCSPLOWO2_01_FULL_48_13]
MDEQNKNNLENAGITPPDPTNELMARTPEPVLPTPAPVSTEKVLEDKLAEIDKQTTTNTPIALKPEAKKKKRWIFWLVLILLLAAGAAIWYFLFWLPQQTFQPNVVTDQRSSTFIYRSSTFPTANLTIKGGVATLTTRVLNPLPNAPYQLVLARMDNRGTIPQLPSADNQAVIALGNFDINAEGKVVAADSGTNTFALSGDVAEYNSALVMIDGGGQIGSTVLLGRLNQNEQDTQTFTAKLNFPVDLSVLLGALQIKTVQGQSNPSLQITFLELPDIANLGYIYEAHLVKFEGPYVKKDETLGRFSGNKLGVDINLSPDLSLDNFTNLIISLEPTWDTDKEISQIKPFIAEL